VTPVAIRAIRFVIGLTSTQNLYILRSLRIMYQ